MASLQEQIAQLEAGIEAQESLRATLGDAVVDAALTALNDKLAALRAQHEDANDQRMQQLQSFLPKALAEKMQATGGIEGERKQVTVLAVEIPGFGALGRRLDSEEAISVTNAALKELAEAVYHYEGYVDRLAGDSVTVVMGAPVTHEDDAERALRVALELRERLERFNREWISCLGEPLALHMGVNSGTVSAGNVGSDLRMAYTVVGDTVTSAARLQDAAEPGQILVSRSTHRLAAAAFTFVALEPIRVKDQREPLMVYELGRARLGPGKPRGLHDLASAFVGRDDEMSRLQQVTAGLKAGTGCVVAISGEAGIGKSRLMAEWRSQIEAGEHATWLEGRCLAHTASVAYGPFLDLIRRHAGIRDEQTEETARWRLDVAVERLFPENEEAKTLFANLLAFRLSPEESKLLKAIPNEERRDRLFDLMTQLFTQLTQEGPRVLVIEDMQWADATSLELVEHLLPLVSDGPLALVSVSRLLPEALAPMKAAQARYADRFTAISLDCLSESGSLELVCQLLTVEELPTALRRLILQRAEGNPFFVEELIRTLIERGALARGEDGAWRTTPLIETLTVPGTLQGLLMARLDRLPVETKTLAQKASVIGRTFLHRVLRQIAQDEDDIDADLSQMERDNLIRERAHDPELEYMFHHALTQEVAYESLLLPRRKELHCSVGQAMEMVFADRLAEFHTAIGGHYLNGERWEKAFEYLLQAGDANAGLYANSEARKLYRLAEDAHKNLPDSDENRRRGVDLDVKLAEVSWLSDSPEELLKRLQRAEEQAQDVGGVSGVAGDKELRLTRVRYWLGRIHYLRAAFSEAIAYFEQVLPVAQEFDDRELLAVPLASMGRTYGTWGYFSKSEKLLREAIPALEEMGNWKEWIRASAAHGFALAAMGDPASGISEAESAVGKAQEMKALTEVAVSHTYLTGTYLFADELPRALECASRQAEVAEQSNDHLVRSFAHGWWSWTQSRMGDYESASQNMARSQQIAQEIGGKVVMQDDLFLAVRAEIALGLGHLQQVIELAGGSTKVLSLFAHGLVQRAWGQALDALEEPQPDEAEEHLLESIAMLDEAQHRLEAARSRVALAKHYSGRNPAAAREELDKALEQWEASGLNGEAERTRELLQALDA